MRFYDHPAFAGLDKNFLMSLEQRMNALSGKDSTEVLATLMAISNEAKRYHVSFTPERQEVLIDYLRSNLAPQKRKQFDMLVAMMKKSSF